MSEMLRAFDLNFARRRLHDLLFEAADAFPLGAIPHTFDSESLAAFATKTLRRRDVIGSDLDQPLLLRAGIHECLLGRDDRGCAAFETGLKRSRHNTERALFEYAIGHWVHFRSGDAGAARRVLLRAHELAERGRRVRTEVELLLGRIYRGEGDFEAAERMYRHVLDRGVLEFRALAYLYLAVVYAKQQKLDRANEANETGVELVAPGDDWRIPMLYRQNLAEIHAQAGDFERCREVLREIIDERFYRFDIGELAKTYNNHALICQELGDREAARDGFRESIRCHAMVSRPALVATCYVNLARLLLGEGDVSQSLAALERAVAHAQEARNPGVEFHALATAIRAAGRRRAAARAIPAAMSRCREIIEDAPSRVSHDALSEFVRSTESVERYWGKRVAGLSSLGDLASSDGRRALATLVNEERPGDLQSALEHRLGEGMGYEDAPSLGALRKFLMLFVGDTFKSMSYQREFGSSQSRAKYHLRWLVSRNVIERVGSRKASVYLLAFHRTP